MKKNRHAISLLIFSLLLPASDGVTAQFNHALSLYDEPHYDENFTHFSYANPHAPKGGKFKTAIVGQYDNFNPFILKGVAASGMGDYFFETLFKPSYDEAASHYGLIASSAAITENGRKVTFRIRKEARFHDGNPITAEDVVFSFNILMEKGHPSYELYYRGVENVTANHPHEVTFHLAAHASRELPLIIASYLPILSEKGWLSRNFSKPSLEPPIGSGPYRIQSFDLGDHIIYQRDPDYWGRNLAVNQGRYNFDLIQIDYYRDNTVALEGFRSHAYDFRSENQAKAWAHGYQWEAVTRGDVIVETVPHQKPTGMQGFAFNLRKNIFADRRVREALTLLYDFPWANRNLFHNAYTRSNSYFSNSDLAAKGKPTAEELTLLEPFAPQLPAEIMTQDYHAPEPKDETGGMRAQIRKARKLLAEAGWKFHNQKLIHSETQQPFEFEILLRNPQFERVAAPYIQNLKRLGITAHIRFVQDDSQYQKRLEEFDFDMIVTVFPSSLTPGNELRDMFSSIAADTKGSRNLAGIKHSAVDHLIEEIITSQDRSAMITRTRALDRILLWNAYVIPHWHIGYFRIAWWNIFDRPKKQPPYNLSLDFWWYDEAKAQKLP